MSCDVARPWKNTATLLCSARTQEMFLKVFRNIFPVCYKCCVRGKTSEHHGKHDHVSMLPPRNVWPRFPAVQDRGSDEDDDHGVTRMPCLSRCTFPLFIYIALQNTFLETLHRWWHKASRWRRRNDNWENYSSTVFYLIPQHIERLCNLEPPAQALHRQHEPCWFVS